MCCACFMSRRKGKGKKIASRQVKVSLTARGEEKNARVLSLIKTSFTDTFVLSTAPFVCWLFVNCRGKRRSKRERRRTVMFQHEKALGSVSRWWLKRNRSVVGSDLLQPMSFAYCRCKLNEISKDSRKVEQRERERETSRAWPSSNSSCIEQCQTVSYCEFKTVYKRAARLETIKEMKSKLSLSVSPSRSWWTLSSRRLGALINELERMEQSNVSNEILFNQGCIQGTTRRSLEEGVLHKPSSLFREIVVSACLCIH